MARQYEITEVLQGSKDVDTVAQKHFQVGNIIDTMELKKFCRAYGIIYESDPVYKNKRRFIRAKDYRGNIHVEAWSEN